MSTKSSAPSNSTYTSLLSVFCPSNPSATDYKKIPCKINIPKFNYNPLFNYDKRTVAMRKELELKRQLRKLGHGTYNIFEEEEELFDSILYSDKFICHFSVDDVMSEILDYHLNQLSKLHLETKFAVFPVELSNNILKNLEIDKVPCIVIFLDGRITNYIEFQTIVHGGTIDTLQLEHRLCKLNAIQKRSFDSHDHNEIAKFNKSIFVLYEGEDLDPENQKQ